MPDSKLSQFFHIEPKKLALVVGLFYNWDFMTLLVYIVYPVHISTHITFTINNKTLFHKSIIVKFGFKSLSKSLLNCITYVFVFHQNLLSILLFMVDILQFFEIYSPYSISLWYKNLI